LDHINGKTRPLTAIEPAVNGEMFGDVVGLVQVFEKPAILLFVVLIGATTLTPLFTPNQQHCGAVIFHRFQRAPSDHMVELRGLDRRLFSTDIEAFSPARFPPSTKGGIGNHHVLTARRGAVLGGIVLSDVKALLLQECRPLIVKFIDGGLFGAGSHQQGTMARRGFVDFLVNINAR
jgi:hypothetical protein